MCVCVCVCVYFKANPRNRLIYILTYVEVKNKKMLFNSKGLSYHCSFDI